MLPALVLLVSLAQDPAPPQFMWNIEGIYNPGRFMLVTVQPPRGFASVKTITLDPLPTPDDPKPSSIQPVMTVPMPDGAGLRAWFSPLSRPFNLAVTLSDGSAHKIDIYALRRPKGKRELKVEPLRPYPEIAPKLSRA